MSCSRCCVRTQVIISSRVHVSATSAARAPGMGEHPADRVSSPDRCAKTSDNSCSLNVVDCFPDTRIIVSIDTKGIHVLHCLLTR